MYQSMYTSILAITTFGVGRKMKFSKAVFWQKILVLSMQLHGYHSRYSTNSSPLSRDRNPSGSDPMAVSPPTNSGRSSPSISTSETSPSPAGDCSDQRDVDTLTQALPTRSEEYRLLFRLPPDEVLIQDFNCALQESILLQGHMYVFTRHICFYSNIFGFETKKTIPFHEVTCVRKAKTAAIFPNAIEIVCGEKKNFFGSFLSRDEAYKLVIDGWAQHCSDAKALLDRKESKSDNTQDITSVISESATESQRLPNNSSSADMDKGTISSEEGCLSNVQSESEGSEKLPDQGNEEEQNSDDPSSIKDLNWQPEDADAPKIPQHFAMIAEANFPISVEEFFTLFISDHASDFLENYRRRCGAKDLQCTSWHQHEQYGHARDLTYLHPVKLYLGAKFSRCLEAQKFRVYRNSHLMFSTSQQVSDVPYSDYFTIQGIWDVQKNGNEEKGCILRVYFSVPFSKKTMFKGKIEQTTKEELREALTMWINDAHDFLNQKKIEKHEGNDASQSTSMIKDREVGMGSCSKEEILSEDLLLTATSSMVWQNVPDGENFDPQTDSPVQETCGHTASLTSGFRDSLTTFVSYINARSQFPLYLLVAVVAILIVMQISIIVLLSRGPQVHFVTQANHISSFGSYGSEDLGWLERQIGHLKEEMLMLEARTERMRLEHAVVKANLLSLQNLKPKK